MEKDELLVKIGGNIKNIRESKKMLQQDLAALCNYETSTMSRIEAGGSNFTIGTLNKIANALNVTIIDLLK